MAASGLTFNERHFHNRRHGVTGREILNAMNKRALKACAMLSVTMVATGGHAASFNLGTVSSTPTSFSATPTLPTLTNDNYQSRSVDIDDTYSFTVGTQSALSATLSSTSSGGMFGVVTWNLNYSLLDAQSNVVATGVLNPTPVTWKGGQCQTYHGQQVNCTDTFYSYTTNLVADNLLAGQYKLHITGTETAQIYGGAGYDYRGTVVTTPVPEPGTAVTLALGLLGLGFATRRKAAKAD
jgi:hypothetical protein